MPSPGCWVTGAYQFGAERDADERGDGLLEAGVGHLVIEVVHRIDQELVRVLLPVLDQPGLVVLADLVVRGSHC